LGTAALALLATARAGPPKVDFDVSYSVACRDVTPRDRAEAQPNQRLIEARFEVSALVRRGKESDVRQLMYEVSSPKQRLRVVDFSPKTQLESEFTDPIQVVDSGEDSTSLDASLSARLSPLGGVDLAPTAGASKLSKSNRQEKYSKRGPMQLVVASGTTNRGHGVFFKLKPFSQESLQGRKEFVCRFVVSKDWRADYVYIDCEAESQGKTPWTGSHHVGSRRVLVGLYLQGDSEAREMAERLARAYEDYRGARRAKGGFGAEAAGELGGLLRRLPGLGVVSSAVKEFSGDEGGSREDEARESFLAAMEDLARLAG
jgi:hypothetical protein